jgi:hypothetical protein
MDTTVQVNAEYAAILVRVAFSASGAPRMTQAMVSTVIGYSFSVS